MLINTDSKNYNLVRAGIDFAAFTGGCVAVDSVFIPMIMAVFDKKFKFLRPLGYLGAWAFSVAGGALATSVIDDYTTALVDSVNNLADAKKDEPEPKVQWYTETKKEQFMGLDIPDENASREEEKKFIDDLVYATHCFEFTNENTARENVVYIVSSIQSIGFLTLSTYFKYHGIEVPKRVDDILTFFGWTQKSLDGTADGHFFAIDKINDNLYFADLLNYVCIDNVYNILKDASKIGTASMPKEN